MLIRILMMTIVLMVGISTASAATVAVSTASVNLRAGPATSYPVVTVVPAGTSIVTHGCVSDYTWCDIAYGNTRGWVSADYIQVVYSGAPVVLTPVVATAVGVTIVAYNQAYWDTHYVSYPWYGSWTSYPAYRAGVTSSATAVGPKGGTASRTTGCVGSSCGTVGTATGANGGTAAGVRGCGPQGCGAAGAVTGPGGNTAAGAAGCGPRGCSAAVVGPQGNTAHRRVPR